MSFQLTPLGCGVASPADRELGLPTPAEPERVAPASASRSGPVPRVGAPERRWQQRRFLFGTIPEPALSVQLSTRQSTIFRAGRPYRKLERSSHGSVPELTCSSDIQLNELVSLRQRAKSKRAAPDIAHHPDQHGEAVGRLYSARRLYFSSGQPPLRVSADDAGTFLQIRLFSHPDCSDSILALVLVRPRRPDLQTLRKRQPLGGAPTSPLSIHYLSRDRVVSDRKMVSCVWQFRSGQSWNCNGKTAPCLCGWARGRERLISRGHKA